MQIEPILFEFLSVLERIQRAKGNKRSLELKIGRQGVVNILLLLTRPKLISRKLTIQLISTKYLLTLAYRPLCGRDLSLQGQKS